MTGPLRDNDVGQLTAKLNALEEEVASLRAGQFEAYRLVPKVGETPLESLVGDIGNTVSKILYCSLVNEGFLVGQSLQLFSGKLGSKDVIVSQVETGFGSHEVALEIVGLHSIEHIVKNSKFDFSLDGTMGARVDFYARGGVPDYGFLTLHFDFDKLPYHTLSRLETAHPDFAKDYLAMVMIGMGANAILLHHSGRVVNPEVGSVLLESGIELAEGRLDTYLLRFVREQPVLAQYMSDKMSRDAGFEF